jgi:hypothetical protein
MTRLRIEDLDGGSLAFDLVDLVPLLGVRGVRSFWTARVEELISRDEVEPEKLYGEYARETIPGEELATLASQTRQVIDGVFSACDPGSSIPWVLIEAIDSSYWEVESESADVISAVRARFNAVRTVQSDAV